MQSEEQGYCLEFYENMEQFVPQLAYLYFPTSYFIFNNMIIINSISSRVNLF